MLLGALAAVGLHAGDVRIETAGPQTIVQRVVTGSADACACVPDWEVEISNAQPGAIAIPTSDVFPSMAQAMLASDRMIAAKPDMLRAVVGATLRGMRFIMADPRKAAETYMQAIPGSPVGQDLLSQIFRSYIARAYSGQPIAGRIDPNRLAALQTFYLRQGFIQHAVPVATLYTNDFVPVVEP